MSAPADIRNKFRRRYWKALNAEERARRRTKKAWTQYVTVVEQTGGELRKDDIR